jgi:membrane associated rhomboid family serine protease
MSFLEKWERKVGHWSIPHLIRYVVGFNALVYLLQISAPGYTQLLELSRPEIMNGEVWRLFTWIFIPRTMSPLFMLIALYFLWFLGEGLETMWGSFRVNLFYFTGMFGCTLAAMIFGGGSAANTFLNLSILFAFATLQPNYTILLFFVLPLKIKWLAWFSFGLVVLTFLGSPLGGKMLILVSLANYLLFFGPAFVKNRIDGAANARRLAAFRAANQPDSTLHSCRSCGRTEVSDPDLDFRVAADGEEYCIDHLPSREKDSLRQS